jgi:lipid-binding SYLF domain-containing protein
MTGRSVYLALALLMVVPASTMAQSDQADRIREAGTVFGEIMGAPDREIPHAVLDKAEGIAVFPSTLKGAFIVGAQRGRGIISVKNHTTNQWSPPAFLTLTGGSVGAQIGGQAVDVVLIIMNRRGLENLLRNQFKIGGEASATAGPVGRDAEASTDIQLRAQILSYSRSRGLFAGVSLKGSAVRQDLEANQAFYGKPYYTRDIVLDGKATQPESAEAVAQWTDVLTKYAPAH